MVRLILLVSALVLGSMAGAQAQGVKITGAYTYSGTNPDGSAEEPGKLTVTVQPSGAFEVKWDGGDYVGIGQLQGNLFAVASVVDGKNSIMLMTANPDGTVSGSWWRRSDSGSKGTEVWVPAK